MIRILSVSFVVLVVSLSTGFGCKSKSSKKKSSNQTVTDPNKSSTANGGSQQPGLTLNGKSSGTISVSSTDLASAGNLVVAVNGGSNDMIMMLVEAPPMVELSGTGNSRRLAGQIPYSTSPQRLVIVARDISKCRGEGCDLQANSKGQINASRFADHPESDFKGTFSLQLQQNATNTATNGNNNGNNNSGLGGSTGGALGSATGALAGAWNWLKEKLGFGDSSNP